MNNQENLLAYYKRELPVSAMALAFLFDKGADTVSRISVDEYTTQVKADIEETEAKGGIYFMSLDVAVRLFEIAKELAKYSVMDIITALPNAITGKTTLRLFIDEEVPFRLKDIFGMAEEDIDDDIVFTCAEALENDSDIMLDYDAIDNFLRKQLTEMGVDFNESEGLSDDPEGA